MMDKLYRVTNKFNSNILEPTDFLRRDSDIRSVNTKPPGILVITSYPPRECGIATYSKDLITSLETKFKDSFDIQICAVVCDAENINYCKIPEVRCTLNTDCAPSFALLAESINADKNLNIVIIQHEFGFYHANPVAFIQLLITLTKPIIIVFHTVLPSPNEELLSQMQIIASLSAGIIVMTQSSARVLVKDYGIDMELISIIPHGTHLVQHTDKLILKDMYHLSGKKIISTFGLLSSGKNIETTISALPEVIKNHPDLIFLIIGKTHPVVFKSEGEKYRNMLEEIVIKNNLQNNVLFINRFLPLTDLLNYLQLTDVYVFTSKDPNQAVSGTFSYALSCGCPIISTPIPHALEVIEKDAGIIIDFENPKELSKALNKLLDDEQLRKNMSSNILHLMAATCWENSANNHALLFKNTDSENILLKYTIPPTNLDHIKKMTSEFGMMQFSKINQPDISSGYTLDDNARALIAFCLDFSTSKNKDNLTYIQIYLNFIRFCQQPQGNFKNYVDDKKRFTLQNNDTNLEDSNGRAIWALGYLISLELIFPEEIIISANTILDNATYCILEMHSTRAMAFSIKGLCFASVVKESNPKTFLIRKLTNRIVQMYRHESSFEWDWYESYLTYANSVIPEALLYAWSVTKDADYLGIAKSSFDFLLSNTFRSNNIKVISNKGWLQKGKDPALELNGGEQPIDVAYTIIALAKFYDVFKSETYLRKMQNAFHWFLGENHLHQIIYNPCTGGCYDGLEENYVNLNQGAESTLSYTMAKLTIDSYYKEFQAINMQTKKTYMPIVPTRFVECGIDANQ
jgi:glycosyltransferase involved in cell wall biosynthesis